MRFLPYFAVLFFAALHHPAFSAITVQNITGVTSWYADATGTQLTAGFSGPNGAVCSGTGLCNTCQSCTAPATPGAAGSCGTVQCCACNERAVHPAAVFTLNFRSDTVFTGIPKLRINESQELVSTGGTGTGGNFVFTNTWFNLCAFLATGGGGTACSDIAGFQPKTVTIEVSDGISTTPADSARFSMKLYNQPQTNATSGVKGQENDGSIRAFRVFPGDEKVYVEDVFGAGTFPQSASGIIKFIRFYISSANLADAYITSNSGYADLSVDANGELNKMLDGLSNDVTYHFRPASVDEAGNIFNVMDDALLANSGGMGADGIEAPESICNISVHAGGNTPAEQDACRIKGTPSKVLGLLTEDMNCFIASAAYGSSLDPHIKTFREFRFKVLLPSKFGQKLNYTYYKYGPYLARFIGNHEWAKAVSRAALWPAWGLAKLSVEWNLKLWQTLSLFLFSLSFLIAMLYVGLKKITPTLGWK